MHSNYEDVLPAVESFQSGAYCSTSEQSEIDTPFHQHNKDQFVYAQKGTLHVETRTNRLFLPVEHFIWIPRHTEHRVWTNNTQIIMFTIYFDREQSSGDFYNNMGVHAVNKLLHEMIHYAIQWNGHIDESQYGRFEFLQAFKAILPDLSLRRKPPMLGFVQAGNKRLTTVMDYMRDHLEEKITLNGLADKFGFSPRSLSRLFQKEDINFTEYLQSIRLVKAMELLAEKSLSIETVSLLVGYESPSSFSNIFMRYTGMRPSEYIQNN